MKVIKIKKDWFSQSDVRLDASYHLSDGVQTRFLLNKLPYEKKQLSDVTSRIFYGGRARRLYVENKSFGIPFMGSSDMLKSNLNGLKYISKKNTKNLNDFYLQKEWTLISRSGTIGKTVFTNSDYENIAASEHIIRIVPKNILSGYLYSFLTSKFGFSLLTQGSFGAVIQHIEPEYLNQIPIPILPEEKQMVIHNLILEASELSVEANRLLIEADDLFHKENNLNYTLNQLTPSENSIQTGFSIKKSDFLKTTFKARNHSIRATQIIDIWNSKDGKSLTELVGTDGLTRGMGGFFKRITDSSINGMDIISQGDIHERKSTFKQVIKTGIKETELAKTGMVILPAAGTLGENEIFLRPQLIYKNFEGKVLSEVVGKLRPIDIKRSAYLYVALSSIGGFRILRTMVYGTNLMYPNWELLKRIKIPCKNNETLEMISNIVINSFEKMALSKAKENQAIDLIEKEIESWQE